MNRASVNGTIQARQRKPSGGSRLRSVGAPLKVGLSALFLASTIVCGARADVITDWNEQAVAAGYTARQLPPVHSRIVAMVHLAMFEALNSIEPHYQPYRARLPVEPGTSAGAAAAAAAHHILVRIYPTQAKDFDLALRSTLASVTDETSKANGIRLGEQSGAVMLAERSKDGADAANTYRPFTTPGQYVPTVLPVGSTWGSVRPFALRSGDQFRPAAPYSTKSAEWAKDYNEVKRMGANTGSARSAEQTEIARFWELTGAATYFPIVRQLAVAKQLDVMTNARLFALVAMSTADSMIAVFDAKYAYNFWRPVTAIRNGDPNGKVGIERDATWEPIIATPMHPEYPCAHCITSEAAASALRVFFGDAIPAVKLTSTTAPGVTRSFVKLSAYSAEVLEARVYDGVHYRTSGEVGAAMGRKVAEFTMQNYLKPLP